MRRVRRGCAARPETCERRRGARLQYGWRSKSRVYPAWFHVWGLPCDPAAARSVRSFMFGLRRFRAQEHAAAFRQWVCAAAPLSCRRKVAFFSAKGATLSGTACVARPACSKTTAHSETRRRISAVGTCNCGIVMLEKSRVFFSAKGATLSGIACAARRAGSKTALRSGKHCCILAVGTCSCGIVMTERSRAFSARGRCFQVSLVRHVVRV